MSGRKPPEQQLAELEEKQAQLKARIDQKRAQVRSAERKRDTRRKIIAGAVVLEHAQIDPIFGATLRDLLARHVTRDEDRKLLDL